MTEIVLALGSNIGAREEYLNSALELLQQEIELERVSSWLENKAVGGPDGQGDFLNGAVLGRTELEPYALLSFIKNIELELGRDPEAERWSARVIDIDIIFYGNEIINSEQLTIPHSLMHKREFVLVPLCEICPEYLHPVLGIAGGEILRELRA